MDADTVLRSEVGDDVVSGMEDNMAVLSGTVVISSSVVKEFVVSLVDLALKVDIKLVLLSPEFMIDVASFDAEETLVPPFTVVCSVVNKSMIVLCWVVCACAIVLGFVD